MRGFSLLFPELPIGRSVLEMGIARDLEGTTQELELVRRSVDRARAIGARVAHICVAGNPSRAKMLEAEGFSRVRVYWDMVWSQDELPDQEVPPGFIVRSYRPGDATDLTEAQNSAFEGSWGFCPNTVDQIEYRSQMPNTSNQGILILNDGDKTAGYCWTCLSPLNESTRDVIGMIGVVPEYRGRESAGRYCWRQWNTLGPWMWPTSASRWTAPTPRRLVYTPRWGLRKWESFTGSSCSFPESAPQTAGRHVPPVSPRI